MGLRLAAFFAGYKPKNKLTVPAKKKARSTISGFIKVYISVNLFNKKEVQHASKIPIIPPTKLRTAASARNWIRISHFELQLITGY